MTTEGGGVRLEALVLGDEGGGCILSILGLGEAAALGPPSITGRVGWGRAGNILCDWLGYCCEVELPEELVETLET